jgi:hypothetical protein
MGVPLGKNRSSQSLQIDDAKKNLKKSNGLERAFG